MEAAFVEIGLEKNGFLYVDEIVVPELEGKRHGKKIQDLISARPADPGAGREGPDEDEGRAAHDRDLAARPLPRLRPEAARGSASPAGSTTASATRLKDIVKDLDAKDGGIIVRTAAEGASAEDIERDLVFLQRLWKTIQAKAKTGKAPALVYQEAELPLRIVARPLRRRLRARARSTTSAPTSASSAT